MQVRVLSGASFLGMKEGVFMENKNWEENTEEKKAAQKQVSNLIQISKENKKMIVILAIFAVLIIGALVVVGITEKKAQIPVTVEKDAASETTEGVKSNENTIVVPEETMEKDAHPEVNNLVKQYYQALVDGDMETIHTIKSYTDEDEELKIVKKSEFIESYPNIVVYTKKGPEENSFVAYVQYDVKFVNYEGTAPGLNTLYICQNEEGNYYINSGELDEEVVEYLKAVSVQNDVMDLFNTVQVAYNDVKTNDEELSLFLDELPQLLAEAVSEAIAEQEAAEAALKPEEEEETELVMEVVKTVKTTDVVNVRSSDSIEADKLGSTTKGQILDLIEERVNGWSKVKFEGKEGYIKSEFLEPYETETIVNTGENGEEGEEQTTETAVTKGKLTDTVNVRKTASTEGEKLGQLSVGSSVEIIEKMSNGWTKIKYNNGEAYVKSEFIE